MQYERRWLAVIAVGLSIFLSALDATIVALALPSMAHHFQLSDSLASAVTLSYAIPLTVLILPSGDLVSRFRTLPTFLIAVLGFGLGSLACGLAPNFPLLLVGRVIQGGFGALIATQGIAVAAAVVAPTERGRAIGLIGSLALPLELAIRLLCQSASLPAGGPVRTLELARSEPGRATPWSAEWIWADGRVASPATVSMELAGIPLQHDHCCWPLLPFPI